VAVVRGLRRSYGSRTVIDDLDLTIGQSEIVALVGKSGCGKTTLLRTLAGLDVPQRGVVEVPAARSVAFQEPRLLPWLKVWRNVGIGMAKSDRRQRALEMLREVGLKSHADVWPLTLSGGEAQRVALARALVREPELLLLDEPFGALDAFTRMQMHELVRQLHRRHRPAILLVTHDVDEALLLADRVITLQEGRVGLQVQTAGLFIDRLDPAFERARSEILASLGVEQATRS
jgi:sulfonate transport system ATP-binding protein